MPKIRTNAYKMPSKVPQILLCMNALALQPLKKSIAYSDKQNLYCTSILNAYIMDVTIVYYPNRLLYM